MMKLNLNNKSDNQTNNLTKNKTENLRHCNNFLINSRKMNR